MTSESPTATLLDALRQTEHFGVQDDGRRFRWLHYRPHGCTTVSSETFGSYSEACMAAVRVAASYSLPADPIVSLIADQAEVDEAQSGRCDWRWA